MSEPSIINTPAACIKCGFITDSPTTGKTHDRCPCCGGKLITISQLTPGENVIVLAKRASWECSNDDGEWYGRKTTEEQIIKHFASLGTELAALRAKLEEKERECERLTELHVVNGTHKANLNSVIATLQEQHRQQSEELARANGLLAVAKCPNCDGCGWFEDVQPNPYTGEAEQVQRQCQWCDERAQHLAKKETT